MGVIIALTAEEKFLLSGVAVNKIKKYQDAIESLRRYDIDTKVTEDIYTGSLKSWKTILNKLEKEQYN